MQTLVDRDGVAKTVLQIIIEEAVHAGIEEVCVVVCPGDEAAYRAAAGEHDARLLFLPQEEPLGYGHALYCARGFVGEHPFLHMVGDHIYLSGTASRCARQLLAVAEAHSCSVSAVQPTRENLLPYFGAVGGQRIKGSQDLYAVDRVIEKPTPTEAEQSLLVPGLRAGNYLCFFGMHVLSPVVMELLRGHVEAAAARGGVQLSPVLAELAGQERYLAFEIVGRRYPVDGRYGLLTAQLALALSGQDRDEVLTGLCELLAQREIGL